MIPEGWKIELLGDFMIVRDGVHQTPTYTKSGIPFLRVTDIQNDKINLSNTKYISKEEHDKLTAKLKPKNGDILYSKNGTIGITRIIDWDWEFSFFVSLALLRLRKDGYSVQYLAQYLQSNLAKREIYQGSKQGSVINLHLEEIQKFRVPIPPLPEQRKIVEILSTWDKAIALLEQLITAKRKLKQGLMQQLLTGKKRFKEFGLPIFSEEYLPNKWNKVALKEVVAKEKYSFTGGPFGSNLKAEHYTDEGIRIIQLQNIGDGKFNDKYKIFTTKEKADELISCNIYPGDIIISKMGDPVARACFVPDSEARFLMASDGIRLKVDKSKFDPIFLLEQINSPIFRKIAISHSTGSTRQRIGLDVLRELPILVPPIEEQKKLAFVFSTITKEILNLEKQLVAYKQQKRGLMQQLLTGKKRVKIDEPQMQKVY